MHWMLAPYKRYAEFSGRSRRMEYWMFRLFEFGAIIGLFLIVALVAGAAGSAGGGSAGGAGVVFVQIVPLLISVLVLGSIIPSLAVTVRRLHDTGRSGWYMFISLIPLIGAIMLLIALFSEGTRGANKYGSDPKGGDLSDEVFA